MVYPIGYTTSAPSSTSAGSRNSPATQRRVPMTLLPGAEGAPPGAAGPFAVAAVAIVAA